MITPFLNTLPPVAQILLLGLLGVLVGVLINWAIYAWTLILHRPICPWMKPHAKESPRRTFDYVPVIGWWGRRRDESLYGSYFWLRPMLIELGAMLLAPCFYFWLARGGLVDFAAMPTAIQTDTWFLLFGLLMALMCIATFIDFDEKMIPDSVTIPGTLMGLGFAALAPWSRLPEASAMAGAWGLDSINYYSPNFDNQPLLEPNPTSLLLALGLFAIWIWALLPKLPVWYVGWWTSVKLTYAHAFRPKRKTKCEFRIEDRSTPMVTKLLCWILVLGLAAIGSAWAWLPTENWQSLLGSLFGMAFGGGLIWAIRVVGTLAMGREAMGFGDVTLMAMIGACFGWQAVLMAFVYTVMVVVVMLVLQILITGSQELAFGPYLCAGAVVLLVRWGIDWPGAAAGVFSLGVWLLYILIASMFLLGAMLLGIQWFKGLFVKT